MAQEKWQNKKPGGVEGRARCSISEDLEVQPGWGWVVMVWKAVVTLMATTAEGSWLVCGEDPASFYLLIYGAADGAIGLNEGW